MPVKPYKRSSALNLTTALGVVAAIAATSSVATAQDEPPPEREVITVTGSFIPEERRDTSEISAVVDVDDFAQRGDADAAVALQRVTGLSISRGRFIFARGLNERYSNATLNGSPLPGPEPLRRTVPLDLFPTSVLESALAQKTWSPQYSGEFGGAVIDLRTRTLPDEGFIQFGISGSANSETTWESGLLYDGGQEDWTGFDDGIRNRPSELAAIRGVSRVGDVPVGSPEREALSRSLENDASLWVVQRGDIPANGSASLTLGQRFDFSPNISMGILASGGYSNEWQTRNGIRGAGGRIGTGGVLIERQDPFELLATQNTIGLNGFATVGFDLFDNHQISFTGLAVRATEKETRRIQGIFVEPGDQFIRQDSLDWFERQVWTTQVQGTHLFPNLNDMELSWRASYSEGFRDAPYQRQIAYVRQPDGSFLYQGEDNSTNFSYIQDDTTDWGVDVRWPFDFGLISGDVLFGYAYTERDRSADVQLLEYQLVSDPGLRALRADLIFQQPGVNLIETGGALFPEAYLGTIETDAGYFGLDMQWGEGIRVSVGARYEDSIEAVDSFNFGDDPATNFVEGVIEEEYLLPAATVTFTLADNLQLRMGYSETIIRPQFRELAPTEFLNTETDELFFGNPFLVDTQIRNYDMRLEWYFARDQFLTFGVFEKDLRNPIQEYVATERDGFRTTSFINAPEATLSGVEFEFERLFELGEMFDSSSFLAPYTAVFRANYTYAQSEITANGDVFINGDQASPTRAVRNAATIIEDGGRLFGQSDHLFNLQFGYENYEARSRGFVLVNFASDRVRTAANVASGQPAIIEEPPTSVDFVYSREFDIRSNELEFGFNVRNIFGDSYEAYQEGSGVRLPIDSYELGTSLGLSLRVRR